ncbi:MAG TPA: hypothetical protein VMP68_20475 [Candidatus Eisenbacteria bacterium]|nr:hypothetical protein [Candidatus Eisenbacteria bacterium]
MSTEYPQLALLPFATQSAAIVTLIWDEIVVTGVWLLSCHIPHCRMYFRASIT